MLGFVPKFRYAIWSVETMARWWTGRLEKNRQLLSCRVVFLPPQHQFSPNVYQLGTFAHRVWLKVAYKLGGGGEDAGEERWRAEGEQRRRSNCLKRRLFLSRQSDFCWLAGASVRLTTLLAFTRRTTCPTGHDIPIFDVGWENRPAAGREQKPSWRWRSQGNALPITSRLDIWPIQMQPKQVPSSSSKCPSNFLRIKVLSLTFLSPERAM